MNNNENASDLPDEESKYVTRLESLIEDQTYIPKLIFIQEVPGGIFAWIKQELLRKIKIVSDILQIRSLTKKHLGKTVFSVDRLQI